MTGVSGSALAVLVLLLSVAVPVGIWLCIRSETGNTRVMDRASAERAARADTRERADRRARTDAGDGERSRDRRD